VSHGAWELIFMMFVLKLPVVYLAAVVWWAVRAEPLPPEGAARLVEPAGTRPGDDRRRRRSPRAPWGRRPGPHGAPVRGYARAGLAARARVER
jgi:hypothetical protein